MAQTLDDKTAKRILDMLAKRIGYDQIKLIKAKAKYGRLMVCVETYVNGHLTKTGRLRINDGRQTVLGDSVHVIFSYKSWTTVLSHLLEICADGCDIDATSIDWYANKVNKVTFLKAGTVFEELLIQADLAL